MVRMAENRDLVVDSIDFTDWVVSISLPREYPTAKVTTTQAANQVYAMGTKADLTLTVTLNVDYELAGMWRTLNAMAGTVKAVVAKPDDAHVIQLAGDYNIAQVPGIPDGNSDTAEQVTLVWTPAGNIAITTT